MKTWSSDAPNIDEVIQLGLDSENKEMRSDALLAKAELSQVKNQLGKEALEEALEAYSKLKGNNA